MEKIFFLNKFASSYAELLKFTVMGAPTLYFEALLTWQVKLLCAL